MRGGSSGEGLSGERKDFVITAPYARQGEGEFAGGGDGPGVEVAAEGDFPGGGHRGIAARH